LQTAPASFDIRRSRAIEIRYHSTDWRLPRQLNDTEKNLLLSFLSSEKGALLT
jgi:hypothetical protein